MAPSLPAGVSLHLVQDDGIVPCARHTEKSVVFQISVATVARISIPPSAHKRCYFYCAS